MKMIITVFVLWLVAPVKATLWAEEDDFKSTSLFSRPVLEDLVDFCQSRSFHFLSQSKYTLSFCLTVWGKIKTSPSLKLLAGSIAPHILVWVKGLGKQRFCYLFILFSFTYKSSWWFSPLHPWDLLFINFIHSLFWGGYSVFAILQSYGSFTNGPFFTLNFSRSRIHLFGSPESISEDCGYMFFMTSCCFL